MVEMGPFGSKNGSKLVFSIGGGPGLAVPSWVGGRGSYKIPARTTSVLDMGMSMGMGMGMGALLATRGTPRPLDGPGTRTER